MNQQELHPRSIYLYGCGGHAKVILDILYQQGRQVAALIDDNPPSDRTHIHGVPIYSASQILPTLNHQLSRLIIAIGDNQIRQRIAHQLSHQGYSFTTAIHPSATIALGVKIGLGSVIMANSVVNIDTKIGDHVILNTGSTIDHDCQIGNFAHVAPGCSLCGTIKLGDGVLLGAGSTVSPNLEIGTQTICGAGSVVVRSLPSYSLAYGCPAKVVQKNYQAFQLN